MKGNKVLFGLFASLSLIFTANASAQVNTGSNLVEIGPDNISGRVTSIVVDQSDTTHQTIYAGSASGGLFVRSNDTERAAYANMWNKVPCVIDGVEVTLPISSMVQGPDNTIYIATGELLPTDYCDKFESIKPQLTQGIYRFNPATGEFKLIANSKPTAYDNPYTSISKLAGLYSNGTFYLYAATNRGLYRWAVANENDWNNTPICYVPTHHIWDVLTIEEADMVYFSGDSLLYRISDVSSNSTPINIYGNIPATSQSCSFRLAVAPNNHSYVYAMRLGSRYGEFEGLFLSTNHSTWTLLTPSSVYPFTSDQGFTCGAVCVDPYNAKHVYIGGSSLYSGEGFLDGQLYTWIKKSYSEYEMGSSNYMANTFSSTFHVHSGINQIVSTWTEGVGLTYYIATNGGVYMSTDNMSTFGNINRGLNNISVNGLAVATDGSILIGAVGNANIFIESRDAHNGGNSTESWYDTHPENNTNHMGNVIWGGNGGNVAISRFQQYSPLVRRNIFTSSNTLRYGRASNDYTDYSNTQTWTISESFLGSEISTAYTVPQLCLWEGENVSTSSDTIYTIIDTLAYAVRNVSGRDTLIALTPGTQIKVGDKITVFARNNASYPVVHTVNKAFTVAEGDTIKTKNPIRSNLFIIDRKQGSNSTMMGVYMTWMPSDFRKVWYAHTSSSLETEEEKNEKMQWARIMAINVSSQNLEVGGMATSNDGNILYLAVNNKSNGRSYVYRISGIMSNVDYSGTITEIMGQLTFGSVDWALDTTRLAGTVFNRNISSIAIDPRDNKDNLIITFQGHSNDRNLAYVTNASSAHPTLTYKSVAGNVPAYSALIEYTTGEVYVGTEDGAWVTSESSFNSNNPTWQRYGNFAGLPVTNIIQQTHEMPIKRAVNHVGINEENYVFARTKYPFAIYFGTYGRGVFMDSTYVTNHENEIVDSTDYLGINSVSANGVGRIKLYPNPATNNVHLDVELNNAACVFVRIYDINGKQVVAQNMGYRPEGNNSYTIDCSSLTRGIYMVNVTTAKGSASSKLIIK